MNTQAKLQQQVNLARYMLLGTVIITVINLALLLSDADLYIPYYSAVPYLLVQFGQNMDSILPGNMTAIGLIMAAVILSVYLLVWFLAKDRPVALTIGLVLLILDTLMLLGILTALSFALMDMAMELFLHGVVIYEVIVGISAQKKLAQAENPPT